KTYQGPGEYSWAYAVAVSPDGSRIAVTGWSYRVGPNPDASGVADAATVAYDTEGNQLWAMRYGGGADGTAAHGDAITFSPDGTRVYVAGEVPNLHADDAVYGILAYNAASGSQVWATMYQPAGYYSRGQAITVSHDGATVYVTGDSGNATVRDVATLAITSSTGVIAWRSRYNTGPLVDFDSGISMALAPDGKRLYVGAIAQKPSNNTTVQPGNAVNAYDFLTVGYNVT
ncbi:MAG: hypothetical protein ABR600_01120, partial [Actinomycetota bacterium]